MSKINNTIQINHKLYDAATGLPVGGHGSSHVKPKDRVHIAVSTPNAKPTPHHAAHSSHRLNAHHPQTPKTLMRHAVKKPSGSIKRHLHSSQPISSIEVIDLSEPAELLATRISQARLNRAKAVKPAHGISHFGFVAQSSDHSVKSTAPSKVNSAPVPDATSALIERALKRATSHLEPPVEPQHHKRRRLSTQGRSIIAGSFTLLLLFGFIGYNNLSQIRLDNINSKVGFTATLPSNKPAGFRVGPFSYSPGQVSIHYLSNSDSRNFAVIERPSNWNNQNLVSNYIAPSGQTYQTMQADSGQTIYILGGTNATWLSHGIWYEAQTDGSLSGNQLLSLASNS